MQVLFPWFPSIPILALANDILGSQCVLMLYACCLQVSCPSLKQFLDAIRSRQTIKLGQFELTLREHIIGGWRDLDILTPH